MTSNHAFRSFNTKDSMEINELASLNDDISLEQIEQLQQKLAQNASLFSDEEDDVKPEFNENDDTTLFEETGDITAGSAPRPARKIALDKTFDDNFIKKYKAKLNKQKDVATTTNNHEPAAASISNSVFLDLNSEQIKELQKENESIEQITNGNIKEKAITQEQINYNDSLDFLDGNVKYSKYVIYIDPQNVPFIESLTVKERKNLINSILREQDDVAITKQRFKMINLIIRHIVIAILTILISVPAIYWTINSSLEATINNYRHSQTIFQTLYKEKGKINLNK